MINYEFKQGERVSASAMNQILESVNDMIRYSDLDSANETGYQFVPFIEFGKPKTAFKSDSIITLTPTDVDGNACTTNTDDVKLYLSQDGATCSIPYSTDDVLSFLRFIIKDTSDVEGVLIGSCNGTCSTPKDLTVTPASGSARTATFDVTNQSANDGVKVYRERIFYNSTSHKFRCAWWYELYDSHGLLQEVSAETLSDIQALTECDTS